MRITLEGEKPISWNLMYSGMHWSKRKAEADRVHLLMRGNMGRHPFDCPVDISLTAYFKSRPLDADNICSKLYIDALKGILIKDDTPEYVHSVTTRSLIDKKNPRVEIDITESERKEEKA